MYNNRLTYAVARAGIGATDVPFSQDIVLNIPKDVSYKYVEGQLLNNYQINLRAYGLDEEDEVDTGFIRINKQRNTAEIKMDQKENPTSIIFENSGDADNKEYAWEILDAEGNVVISGTEDAVPSDKLDNLPKGEYTVNLTTMGKSQFGKELQEKIAADIFEIVHGDLVVIHKLVDKDGVETTYGEPLNKDGRVGSSYNTEQEYPLGYKLVEVPANATGEYTKETITVEYIYEIIRPKLTVNYVDEKGVKLADSSISKGKFGEVYETEKKKIKGYELVEIPANASGKHGEEDITVTYVYRLIESKLTVNYVEEDGNKLAEPIKSIGKYGEEYSTEKKEFEGYELVAVPSNASGEYGEEDITVTYVYRLIDDETPIPGGGGEEGGTETGGNGTAVPKPSNPGSGNGSNSGGSGGSINNPSSLPGSESLAQLPQTGADNFAIMGYLGGLLVVIGAVFIIFRRRSANE